MKNFRNNKGITLIVLVITIIVLLILAGVTILTLTGDNGLLVRAKESKVKSDAAQSEEALNLKTMEYITQYVKENGLYPTLENFYQDRSQNKDDEIETLYLLYSKTASISDEYSTTPNGEAEYAVIKLKAYSFTYTIDKSFLIVEVNGTTIEDAEEKQTINDVYEVGAYVSYESNGYSKWIIAGQTEDGIIKLVSLGATEYYQLAGIDSTDAYQKLDSHCNENYVNPLYATKAESYSTSRIDTSNSKVFYGENAATSDQLLAVYPYGWFINAYDTRRVGGVYSLDNSRGTWSYINLNDSSFIRVIVYLKDKIQILSGDGTSELPYVLKAN